MAQDQEAGEVMAAVVVVAVTEEAVVDTEVSIEGTDRMLIVFVCCFVY